MCIRDSGIELRIIIEFEFHTSIRHRIALSIRHRNGGLVRRCIVTDYIDFRIIGSDGHYFLRSFITSENFGMHQHATAGRSIEPTQVEYRLRFTSTQEIPFPICPCLYPRMIVVRMGPTGRIDLTGRNTYRCLLYTSCSNGFRQKTFATLRWKY